MGFLKSQISQNAEDSGVSETLPLSRQTQTRVCLFMFTQMAGSIALAPYSLYCKLFTTLCIALYTAPLTLHSTVYCALNYSLCTALCDVCCLLRFVYCAMYIAHQTALHCILHCALLCTMPCILNCTLSCTVQVHVVQCALDTKHSLTDVSFMNFHRLVSWTKILLSHNFNIWETKLAWKKVFFHKKYPNCKSFQKLLPKNFIYFHFKYHEFVIRVKLIFWMIS